SSWKWVLVPTTIVILLGGGLYVALPHILPRQAERALAESFGLPVSLATLNFNPFAGRLEANNLVVANPPGFTTPHFLQVRRFAVAVAPWSLWGDTVHVQTFELEGFQMNLEGNQNGLNIGSVITRWLEQQPQPGQPARPARERRIKADRLLVKDVEISSRLGIIGIPLRSDTLRLPTIDATNLQKADGSGFTTSELLLRVAANASENALKENFGPLFLPLLQKLNEATRQLP
ncbi:MAG: hypothetical protein SNJ60_01230, partial [Pseudanabaenaceae cyanobacterium]